MKIDLNFIKHYKNTNQTTHTTNQAKHASLYQIHDQPHRHALRHGRIVLAGQVLPERQIGRLGPLRPGAKEVVGFLEKSLAKKV